MFSQQTAKLKDIPRNFGRLDVKELTKAHAKEGKGYFEVKELILKSDEEEASKMIERWQGDTFIY